MSFSEHIDLEWLFNERVSEANGLKRDLRVINYSQLVPEVYDYISLSYTGSDLTGVVYKTGGAGGTTVATLTMTYAANILQTVTRT